MPEFKHDEGPLQENHRLHLEVSNVCPGKTKICTQNYTDVQLWLLFPHTHAQQWGHSRVKVQRGKFHSLNNYGNIMLHRRFFLFLPFKLN